MKDPKAEEHQKMVEQVEKADKEAGQAAFEEWLKEGNDGKK